MNEVSDTSDTPPASWLEALDRAEAEFAAGRTVPVGPVLARMQESLARLQTNQARKAVVATKA